MLKIGYVEMGTVVGYDLKLAVKLFERMPG
jgi:hypothetical protein